MAETKEIRKLETLKNWDLNPRSIKDKDFTRLKKQIKNLGQYKPLLITDDGTVLGGNMRLRAYKELGVEDIWVSVVEANTEDKKLEYALSDNDRAGYYDDDLLANLIPNYPDFEWEDYAVDLREPQNIKDLIAQFSKDGESEYSRELKAPIYEPSDKKPLLKDLVNKDKTIKLTNKIQESDLPPDIKEFLTIAASRHFVFDYAKIADFYAHSNQQTKELFEESALIIIDYKKAIENGYVELIKNLMDVQKQDYNE